MARQRCESNLSLQLGVVYVLFVGAFRDCIMDANNTSIRDDREREYLP
jgi:hypothetical protein